VAPQDCIVSVDVDYRPDFAQAAAVVFEDWEEAAPLEERVVRIDEVAPYVPGAFYKRELPCILAVLKEILQRPAIVVVDGYVWLGGLSKPGLGAHLYRALGESTSVIGVAKTPFHSATDAIAITRGKSLTPLFVTAAGMNACDAAASVARMHGPYRIPTLLKRTDALCRQ